MKQKWGFAFLWPNAAVAVTGLVLVLARQITSAAELLRFLAYALAYANLVALLGCLLIGGLAKARPVRRLPLAVIMLFCIFVVVPAGCLLVQTLLLFVGVVQPQRFWREYLSTLQTSIPAALVFGLGALTHASLRERLLATEQKLHEREAAEERARELAAEARLRSLEARIQPHFLFNTLNSISALIAKDPERAEQIVERLATLLRASLDTSGRPLIPLREESAMVESYFEIERARFGGALRGSVAVPPELLEANVPPMSVQVLAENAVKHGIHSRPGGGEVRVTACAQDGNVRIEVSDSGSGFDLRAVPPGHGLDSLVERLDTLFGDKARLNVYRRDDHTVVEMVLPRT